MPDAGASGPGTAGGEEGAGPDASGGGYGGTDSGMDAGIGLGDAGLGGVDGGGYDSVTDALADMAAQSMMDSVGGMFGDFAGDMGIEGGMFGTGEEAAALAEFAENLLEPPDLLSYEAPAVTIALGLDFHVPSLERMGFFSITVEAQYSRPVNNLTENYTVMSETARAQRAADIGSTVGGVLATVVGGLLGVAGPVGLAMGLGMQYAGAAIGVHAAGFGIEGEPSVTTATDSPADQAGNMPDGLPGSLEARGDGLTLGVTGQIHEGVQNAVQSFGRSYEGASHIMLAYMLKMSKTGKPAKSATGGTPTESLCKYLGGGNAFTLS